MKSTKVTGVRFVSNHVLEFIYNLYFSSIEADPDLWGAHVCEIMLDIVIPIVFATGKVY